MFNLKLPFHKKRDQKSSPKTGDIVTSNNAKKDKSFFCCSTCEIVNEVFDNNEYENYNLVDENSIYSPKHESNDNNFGSRFGEVYVKSTLMEHMLKELKHI